jgi:Ca2+/Na+ antiporter
MNLLNLTHILNSNAYSWIQYVFEDHIFKSEYFFLLEIGVLIGYILGIIFIFLNEFIQLDRISKQGVHGIYLLMILELLITLMFLSLTIFNLTIDLFIICFILYIVFSIFIDQMKERYLYQDDYKQTHPKQII